MLTSGPMSGRERFGGPTVGAARHRACPGRPAAAGAGPPPSGLSGSGAHVLSNLERQQPARVPTFGGPVMDKQFLLEQLGARLRERLQSVHRSNADAKLDARSGAARAVNLAKAQGQREIEAREALAVLDQFKPRPQAKGERIGLGAVVEVEDDDGEGKTLFVAPVCAGEELTGPDGDGIFQVVTPSSPFGRAVMGKRVGDVAEVPIAGDLREWTITFVA